MGSLGTHITGFFTDKIRDYSLVSPDQIEAMKQVTRHFEAFHDIRNHPDPEDSDDDKPMDHTEMTDPSLQFLQSCPRIDTPRFTGKNPER